jgi:hypothetical protein
MNKKEFQRIAKESGLIGERHTLWLFPDRLISLITFGWHEQYRILSFKDIRGIIITRNKSWILTNSLSGIIAGIFLIATVLCLIYEDTTGLAIFFGSCMAICLFIIAINTYKGPTCTCVIHTRVSAHQVDAIKRLKKGRKLMSLITPMIMRAQPQPHPIPAAPNEPPPLAQENNPPQP